MNMYEFFREMRRAVVSDEERGNIRSAFYHRYDSRHYIISRLSEAENTWNRRRSDPLLRSLECEVGKHVGDAFNCAASLLTMEQCAKVVGLYRTMFTEDNREIDLLDETIPCGKSFRAVGYDSARDHIRVRMEKGRGSFTYDLPISKVREYGGGNGSAYDNQIFAETIGAFGISSKSSPQYRWTTAVTFYFEREEDEILARLKYPV